MAYRHVIGIAVIGALVVAPLLASAEEGRRRRANAEGQRSEGAPRGESRQGGERAAPRPRESQGQDRGGRSQDVQPRSSVRNDDGQRQYAVPRQSVAPHYAARPVQRPYYSRGGYAPRTVIVPRYIQPTIVTVVPYRPYVYRPRFGIGVYYGAGGAYPYGYTPRSYYDPLPGRPYGGLRITDAPPEAQVFADGYYVGIVDDFDGVFQHANLEAGTHRIEIQAPGFESVAFDVLVQPGRTITFRADMRPF